MLFGPPPTPPHWQSTSHPQNAATRPCLQESPPTPHPLPATQLIISTLISTAFNILNGGVYFPILVIPQEQKLYRFYLCVPSAQHCTGHVELLRGLGKISESVYRRNE